MGVDQMGDEYAFDGAGREKSVKRQLPRFRHVDHGWAQVSLGRHFLLRPATFVYPTPQTVEI